MKKILSILLALCMIMCFMPSIAFAGNPNAELLWKTSERIGNNLFKSQGEEVTFTVIKGVVDESGSATTEEETITDGSSKIVIVDQSNRKSKYFTYTVDNTGRVKLKIDPFCEPGEYKIVYICDEGVLRSNYMKLTIKETPEVQMGDLTNKQISRAISAVSGNIIADSLVQDQEMIFKINVKQGQYVKLELKCNNFTMDDFSYKLYQKNGSIFKEIGYMEQAGNDENVATFMAKSSEIKTGQEQYLIIKNLSSKQMTEIKYTILNEYKINISSTKGGKVYNGDEYYYGNKQIVKKATLYSDKSNYISLRAVPNKGYEFKGFYCNGKLLSNKAFDNYFVTTGWELSNGQKYSNKTIIAKFVKVSASGKNFQKGKINNLVASKKGEQIEINGKFVGKIKPKEYEFLMQKKDDDMYNYFFTTDSQLESYLDNGSYLEEGATYVLSVRGVKTIKGIKVYTDWFTTEFVAE